MIISVHTKQTFAWERKTFCQKVLRGNVKEKIPPHVLFRLCSFGDLVHHEVKQEVSSNGNSLKEEIPVFYEF